MSQHNGDEPQADEHDVVQDGLELETPHDLLAESDERGTVVAGGEQELDTKMLQIQSKRFYLDVKQNSRGRFIKIAEVGAGGRKSRLLMSMSAAYEFRNRLSDFADFYANLGPATPGGIPEDGQLKSETMVKENRRYYLDLKENNRGRFLRVTQAAMRGARSLVVIPADGLAELCAALAGLLAQYGTPDDERCAATGGGGADGCLSSAGTSNGFQGELPESKQLRVDNKMFYFDVGQNNRGVFMRISEVKQNFRSSITIPQQSWSRFRDIFSETCEKMTSENANPAAAPVAEPPTEGPEEPTN